MTLEQLRIFLAVAEREHVTRAAEALNLTQSAVSAAIRALEARHAVTLLHRVGRRVALTEAGRLFKAEAEAVLARVDRAERLLADLAGLRLGRLVLGASQTVASYWLPRLLVRFRQQHPGIALSLTVGNTSAIARAVHDGSADLGLVEGEVDDPALQPLPVADDRLVIVVAPGHPWAAEPNPARPRDLGGTDWVMREPGSGTRSAFVQALRGLGQEPETLRVLLELPSNEAVCAAVAAGAGAAALSIHVVEPLVTEGRLRVVGPALPLRRFVLLTHRERHRTQAAEAMIRLLKAAPWSG